MCSFIPFTIFKPLFWILVVFINKDFILKSITNKAKFLVYNSVICKEVKEYRKENDNFKKNKAKTFVFYKTLGNRFYQLPIEIINHIKYIFSVEKLLDRGAIC